MQGQLFTGCSSWRLRPHACAPLAPQAEVQARADEPGTAFWRLTEGRGSGDDKSAAGRLDFMLQVR